jgi:hypothetical protein
MRVAQRNKNAREKSEIIPIARLYGRFEENGVESINPETYWLYSGLISH